MRDIDPKQELKKRFELILQHSKARILKEDPNVIGIIVDGSVARGDQGPFSDVDIIVLTKPKSKLRKLFYFDDKIQVDIWFMGIDSYNKTQQGDDAWYAKGAKNSRILFDKDRQVKRILLGIEHRKPTDKSIQQMLEHSCRNLLEYAGKARNGKLSKDEYLVRYAAYMIAEASQNPIILANKTYIISENTRWNQLLKAKIKPRHFSVDYPICFALIGEKDTKKVYASAMRLAKESLLFIERELGKNITEENVKSMLSYKSKSDIIE